MNYQLLQERIENLKRRPDANQRVIDALYKWLLKSDVGQRERLNPCQVARDCFMDLSQTVTACLQGVKQGIFDLNWDIRCPHCDMVCGENHDLSQAAGVGGCPMCNIEFETDFSQRVEVTFSLSQDIEQSPTNATCAPPAALKPKFQMAVSQGETNYAVDYLNPGKYRYCCAITLAKGIMVVEGAPTDKLQEIKLTQLQSGDFDTKQITCAPGKIKIELTNSSESLSGLYLHEDELPSELTPEQLPPRVSGLQIIHLPAYQRLFGDQVLSERERIKISSVTVMFTDITGSTSMYEKLGDVKAYNIVRDHFEILFGAIEHHGGTVLKTIGDAVMASFISSEAAIKAAVNALNDFQDYNQNRPEDEQVKVKIGIHRGSTVLVNLNNRLDYFGSTVNKAARIQGVSQSWEISLSEEVYNQEVLVTALKASGKWSVTKHEVDLKGIEGKQAVYSLGFYAKAY
ncbi:MAG TPA: adenylate/guanylate cyclase domain-containing protein [Oscillatoriaceae cyanobacterium M33_DOE_052]|uniref:Adenylate/guanylate cyclase domain-containing protein n=1 Tax=Planktothricoides sp. SpSt-374 TaxID=2282167 RepID=A0A7C3VIN3_9CYAN|nr:adenylate/guanylate cyclase domain-containing protein [Oscillatoriaceae cyanobacterium M33_DOE_052]